MHNIPQHRFIQHTDWGVVLHRVTSVVPQYHPVHYIHQDDYYIFGFLSRGRARGMIDFEEIDFSGGQFIVIQPGQVHRFVRAEGVEGYLLLVESRFVGAEEKAALDRFRLFTSSFPLDSRRQKELSQLVDLLESRVKISPTSQAKAVVNRLVEAFVGIVAEAVSGHDYPNARYSQRQVELLLSFRQLLVGQLSQHRRPAYYADQLHVSTVYLNEVVRRLTGRSATTYIQTELLLRAKRQLCYTNRSVKEVAYDLGFDDSAYFSRLFTRVVGASPTAFRQKNLV